MVGMRGKMMKRHLAPYPIGSEIGRGKEQFNFLPFVVVLFCDSCSLNCGKLVENGCCSLGEKTNLLVQESLSSHLRKYIFLKV